MALVVKNPPVNACRLQRQEPDPWVEKIPWRRTQQPTPVFLHGESHGQRSLAGYSPQGHTESESEVSQSCLTLCNPMDCSLPDFSVHGILQTTILECIAISFSKGSSQPRDWTQVSRIVGRHFTLWATREVHRVAQSRVQMKWFDLACMQIK